jgi:hypothetical protein
MSSVEGSLGTQLLDRVNRTIPAEKVLGYNASLDGLAQSMLNGGLGDQLDGVGAYNPGIDSATNLDIVNSLANKRFFATKTLDTASPSRINVVLDTPERTVQLEGRGQSLPWLAAFTLASAIRIGQISGSKIRVFNTASRNMNGIVFDGKPKDAYSAFRVMSSQQSTYKSNLEDMISVVNTDYREEDATVIVSDFMDGFDSETNTFSWENSLINLARRQRDLMRILRVSSITHTRLPEGLIDGLDGKTLIDMNEAYSAQAEVKDERIKQVFRSLMAKTVITSTDSETPSKDIANLLLGEIKKQA